MALWMVESYRLRQATWTRRSCCSVGPCLPRATLGRQRRPLSWPCAEQNPVRMAASLQHPESAFNHR